VDADEVARGLNPRAAEVLGRLTCAECGALSTFDARGWIAIRAGEADIDDTPEVFFFCPDRAERGFGGAKA
jgi:hypothetical protein